MAAIVSMDREPKHFLACTMCGRVVMRMQTHESKDKKKKTLKGSGNSNEHQLMVTLCHVCDKTNIIRSESCESDGATMYLNKRMLETWYVYVALTKLVGGSIKINTGYGTGTVPLINRGEFIHTNNVTYELTTINIHPNDPEDAMAVMCGHMETGFF